MTWMSVLPAFASAVTTSRYRDVQVQRLALCAGPLGAVEDRDLLAGGGDGGQELVRAEGTVQSDLHEADLLTLGAEVVDDFLGHVADGAHGDDDAVGVGSAVVVEELVVGAELGIDLGHVLLDDGGHRLVVLVGGLTVLEEDVAVLVAAAHGGMLGVEGSGAEGRDSVHVDHFLEILVIPDLDLLQLVAGAEAVEEVQEGNSALDGGQVRHGAQVHDLLHVGLGQHGKAGLTTRHDVAVIAEDVQGVAGEGSGGDVEHAGEQLARDLVHVGDHQQQALGRGVGGGQGACVQGAVDSAGSAGLSLHLLNFDRRTENVFPAGSRPLVNIVGHGAGGGNGVDCCDFGECVGYMGGRVVAVHCFVVSLHIFISISKNLALVDAIMYSIRIAHFVFFVKCGFALRRNFVEIHREDFPRFFLLFLSAAVGTIPLLFRKVFLSFCMFMLY